jgi:hypothetical protein
VPGFRFQLFPRKVFTPQPPSAKTTLDEGQGIISGREPFAYHPKMGRYADLYTHLFGLIRDAMKTRDLLIQLCSLLAVALLAGCPGAEVSKVTRGNLQKIKEGMTMAELVTILGNPTKIGALGSETNREVGWQGRSRKVVASFDENGKLSGMTECLLTPARLSLAMAREDSPIPLPDGARNIQYAAWGFWIAHQEYVRFEASASVCLEHARQIMQSRAREAGSAVIVQGISGPLQNPERSEQLGDLRWFDLERYKTGVEFSLTNRPGPHVLVDTNRGCFYFSDED